MSRELAARHTPWIPIAEQIINDTGQELAKQHHMYVIGTGGAMYDCVHTLSLSFYIYKPLNRSEARKLAVECATFFLQKINSCEAIQFYLESYPFTAKNIEIRIFAVNPDGSKVYDPLLGVVSVNKGKIHYRTYGPNIQYGYKNEFTESFEEAAQIVTEEYGPIDQQISSTDYKPEDKQRIHELLPMNYRPYTPPLEIAIPEDFVAESFTCGAKPNLFDGVVWGTQETLNSLGTRPRQFPPPSSSVFYVRFAEQMQQIGPETFSGEDTLKASLEKAGIVDVNIAKTNWGDFPVLVAEGCDRGRPIHMAWMGLNRGGHVLFFEYFLSKDESHWEEENQIWKRFIHKTHVKDNLN